MAANKTISDSLSELTSDFTKDQTEEFLDELTLGKEAEFTNKSSLYSCHTSTVPFCTTFDLFRYQRKEKDTKYKEYHGESEKHVGKFHCKFCMFKTKDKQHTHERWVSKSDPCFNVGHLEEGQQLTPLCFLSFIKTFSHNLLPSEKTIDPKTVMFSQDSRSILDNKYPPEIGVEAGVAGWGHINEGQIMNVLMNLYWFRKNAVGRKTYKLKSEVRKAIDRVGWSRFKVALKQTFHTINGLLIKKFCALGPELVGYRKIAEQTAGLFKDLLVEYTTDRRELLPPRKSCYEDMKEFFNFTKEWHEHPDLGVRMKVIDYEFANTSMGRFFGSELRTLKNTIDRRRSEGLGDYTTTLAYDFRCITLSQTRNMGYLPPFKKWEETKDFQKKISMKPALVSTERIDMIQNLVVKELGAAGLPRSYEDDNLNMAKIIKDSVHLDLKPSANVNFTASLGGSVEQARVLLAEIRDFKLKAPIRNLENFEITSYTSIVDENILPSENVYNLANLIFWFSLQHAINYAVIKGIWKKDDYYPFLKKPGAENPENHLVIENFLDAEILDIDEGGKLRKLVKCHSYFNWMLCPGSEICQKILAKLPDHTAGLEAGAHDWVFTKRIGGTSPESGFLYQKDGRIKDKARLCYMDWTKATDEMKKRIGIAHLQVFLGYIKFPRSYGKLMCTLVREPQRVKEIHQITLGAGVYGKETIKWNGFIREGFMMGNRLTKTILHLAHVSERGFTQTYLEKRGLEIKRSSRQQLPLRPAIPYSAEDDLNHFK